MYMNKKVRVRFAPSPTGGLHLGGVRTVLYNYLFARANGGDLVLRIEDTDQSRFVQGAEEYIFDCLKWCGLTPDESTQVGGPFAPYRQSERKETYKKYALQLVASGHAYYAFDTPADLEKMRAEKKKDEHSIAQYDHTTRMYMRNSLTLSKDEVVQLLENGTPYVIRIKMKEHDKVSFIDMIRGYISFDCGQVDDKVLLKADGMPTYHLAVVVDDYMMKITHAFRGEEWLPSTPVHLLLWEYLGWKEYMPEWAHLPLILKPDGNGKLSKRDGDRLGFPVFAMNWSDPKTGEITHGFREIGFLPQAFVNMLALLGWNDGTEQEVFTMEELITKFSIDRVHKGGAKFDYNKAKWFNHYYIQHTDDRTLAGLVLPFLADKGCTPSLDMLIKVIALIKDRCTLLTDFWEQGHFFFVTPQIQDIATIKDNKWTDQKTAFFKEWSLQLLSIEDWEITSIENSFNECLQQSGLKKGDILAPFRMMLVGGKFGPGVFPIAELIGKEETVKRINALL